MQSSPLPPVGPLPTPITTTASSRRDPRGLVIGLSIGVVGILLVSFVTYFLLAIRTPQGVGATWAITITGARATDGGTVAAAALQSGDTYLTIDLAVKNVTNNTHDFAGYIDFTVTDGAGKTYKTTYLPGPAPIDGSIPGGASKIGTIAYEVPTSQHAFTLIFADPVYGTQRWSVTV
jgi:hypothetical protein